MKTIFTSLIASVLVALWGLPMCAETLDGIYAKAKGEGALTLLYRRREEQGRNSLIGLRHA